MELITIDGVDENDFRRSIEDMLRHGQADGAAVKLKGLLRPYAGEGRVLPARFLTVSSADVSLPGWEQLADRIKGYDRPEHSISAIGITMTGPVDEAGRLTPSVETSYYSDAAFPFSQAVRDDLLEGYSHYGCEWQGDFEHADTTVSIEGIDDLFEAVTVLETRLLDSAQPADEDIRAGSLGACYLAVLVHQAVRDTVRDKGLPRALCVMAGNSGVYPFFDAPVVSRDECLGDGLSARALPAAEVVMAGAEEPGTAAASCKDSDYDSLLSLGSRKVAKKPVITLDPADREAAASDLVVAQHMAEAGESLRAAFPSEPETVADAPIAPLHHDDALSEPAEPESWPIEDARNAAEAAEEWDRLAAASEEAEALAAQQSTTDLFDISGEIEATPRPDDADIIEERVSPRPALSDQPRSHSLRAQIAKSAAPRENSAFRFLGFLDRLWVWMGLR